MKQQDPHGPDRYRDDLMDVLVRHCAKHLPPLTKLVALDYDSGYLTIHVHPGRRHTVRLVVTEDPPATDGAEA